jgi:hypothetical protein
MLLSGTLVLWACSESSVPTAAAPAMSPAEDSAQVNLADSLPAWSREELLGLFDPSEHPDFDRIPNDWTDKDGIFLRREVLEAYDQMASTDLTSAPFSGAGTADSLAVLRDFVNGLALPIGTER